MKKRKKEKINSFDESITNQAKNTTALKGFVCISCLSNHHDNCDGTFNENYICNCAWNEAMNVDFASRGHKINAIRRALDFPEYKELITIEETANRKGYLAKLMDEVRKSLPLNKRAEILQTAESLINGDRADVYGPPEISFSRIADLWNAMGWVKVNPLTGHTQPLDAVDAALGLVQLKISRTISSPKHEDNWVDIVGYAGLGAEMALRDNGQQ